MKNQNTSSWLQYTKEKGCDILLSGKTENQEK